MQINGAIATLLQHINAGAHTFARKHHGESLHLRENANRVRLSECQVHGCRLRLLALIYTYNYRGRSDPDDFARGVCLAYRFSALCRRDESSEDLKYVWRGTEEL